MSTWVKTKDKQGNFNLPEYRDVVYRHSCGSKGIGKLVTLDGKVRVVEKDGKMKSDYGYEIVAWLDIPEYY